MSRVPFLGISRMMRACGIAVSVVALLKFLLNSVRLPFADELFLCRCVDVELGRTGYMFEDIWIMLLGALLLAIAEGSLILAQYFAWRRSGSTLAEKKNA